MLIVIVIVLGLAAVILTLVMAAIFLRAAFRGEQDIAEAAEVTWRPSFIHGEALRNWAAIKAEKLARVRLTGSRPAESVIEFVRELKESAVGAMLPLARCAELERVVPCPEGGLGLIGVTAPEAFEIAERLRRNHSRAERERIHKLATANSRQVASQIVGDAGAPPVRCPLLGTDHVCSVYTARPLRCRSLHAISVAKTMGDRHAQFPGREGEARDEDQHATTVANGIETGLAVALKSVGLDANVYELNSALAKALEEPDALERWGNGENIFESSLRSPGAG